LVFSKCRTVLGTLFYKRLILIGKDVVYNADMGCWYPFFNIMGQPTKPKPSCKSLKEQGKRVKNRPSDQKGGGLAVEYAKIRKLTEAWSRKKRRKHIEKTKKKADPRETQNTLKKRKPTKKSSCRIVHEFQISPKSHRRCV